MVSRFRSRYILCTVSIGSLAGCFSVAWFVRSMVFSVGWLAGCMVGSMVDSLVIASVVTGCTLAGGPVRKMKQVKDLTTSHLETVIVIIYAIISMEVRILESDMMLSVE